jgi:hypothetical protein
MQGSSLHRSQILEIFDDAGYGSGILALSRRIPLLFWREEFQKVCFDLFN